MDLQIFKHKLTLEEVELFSVLIEETPNITGHTRREWLSYEDVWVAQISGKTVGICVDEDFIGNWSEVAVLYVLEEYRDNGIGRKLYTEGLKNIVDRHRNIYYVSRNPVIIRWMEVEGLRTTTNIVKLPLPVLLHVFRKMFSLLRIKEYVRKLAVFPHERAFLHGYRLD